MRNVTPWLLGLGALGAIVLASARASATPMGASSDPNASPPPPPPGGPETGTQFAARVASLQGVARDNAALATSKPSFVGTWVPVPVAAGALRGTVYVSPDFFAVGTDADYVRWPLLPASAQRLADAYDAVLPTRKIADAVWAAATAKARMPYSASNKDATATYVSTSQLADRRLAGAAGLRDGHRKNILAADASHPSSIIIYGASNPDTAAWPLQPYSWVHDRGYRDYSHGVRLVKRQMDVAGRGTLDILDVMRDPALAPLVSSSSADRNTRY